MSNIFILAIVLIVCLAALLSLLCVIACRLVLWIVHSFARMRIAKKMGVKRGWFAFIPFLSDYLDGKLAEASVEIRYAGLRPFRWGIFLAIFSAVLYVLDLVVNLPSSLILFGTSLYEFMLDTGIMTELIPAELSELIGSLTFLFGAPLSLMLNGIGSLCGIASTVFGVCYFVARYKLLAAMTGDNKVWILVVEILLKAPARFVVDVLLGFTPLFKKHQPDLEGDAPQGEAAAVTAE